MSPDHDHELCTACPLLYANRHRHESGQPITAGFQVGDGWFELLKRLSAKLESFIQRQPEPQRFRAEQVKSKFGMLRFYMSDSTEEMRRAVEEAETESAVACETCGRSGVSRSTNGKTETLCVEHAATS